MHTPFILGVNYWPRRKAMGWWKNFEAGEVHADFALIAELGMKVVRIFLLWEDFQPTPDSVDPRCDIFYGAYERPQLGTWLVAG